MDVDPGQPLYSVEHMAKLLLRAGQRMVRREKRRSGSGKGWHVLVFIEPGSNSLMEHVALQAILGSDRYREACNVLRVNALSRMAAREYEFWSQRFNVLYDGDWRRSYAQAAD